MSMLPEDVRLRMALDQSRLNPNRTLMETVYGRPPSAAGIEQAKIGLQASDPEIKRRFLANAMADPGQMSAADMLGITDLHDIARVGEHIYQHGWGPTYEKGVDLALTMGYGTPQAGPGTLAGPLSMFGERPETGEVIEDMGVTGKVAAPIIGGLGAMGLLMNRGGRGRAPRMRQRQGGWIGGVNSKTANLDELAQAQEMTAHGKNRDEIFKQTGWFKDRDGWKYENPDIYLGIKELPPEAEKALASGRPWFMNLEDYYDNPDLYAAYPDLRKVEVQLTPHMKVTEGAYTGPSRKGSERVTVGTVDFDGTTQEIYNFLSQRVATHEAGAHAVQRREGFAVGGSPQGEQTRAKMEANRAMKDIDRRLDVVQAKIRETEAAGGDIQPLLQERFALIDQQNKAWQMGQTTGMPEYHALAGEAEARNVEYRMQLAQQMKHQGMTDAEIKQELRNNPPWKTMEFMRHPVKEADLVYRRDGGQAFATDDTPPALPAPPEGFAYDQPIPKQGVTGNRRLTKTERGSLAALEAQGATPRARQDVANNAIKYRNTYTPDTGPGAGWQPFDVRFRMFKGEPAWEIVSKKGEVGFNFARNPKTGKPWTRQEYAREVDRISNEMVVEMFRLIQRKDHNAGEIMKAMHWYRDFRNAVRREMGGYGDVYFESQAGTSPNTELSVNFRQGDEFTERFFRGEFDAQIRGVEQHLQAGGTWDNLPDALKPRKRNGTLYGMHGTRLMQIAHDAFRADSAGGAPKMREYFRSLAGLAPRGVIDVWAARTIQRLSGRRMPPPMLSSVAGTWRGSGTDTGGFLHAREPKAIMEGEGDKAFAVYPGMQKKGVPLEVTEEFGMGQDIIGAAVNKLRQSYPKIFGDLRDEELQAMLWLHEKNIWETNGWTNVNRDSVISKIHAENPRTRFQAGISATQDQTPTRAVQDQARQQMLTDLTADEGVWATFPDTYGRYGGENEVSFDVEVVAPAGYQPDKLFDNVLSVARDNNQWDAFVSEVLPEGQKHPNARPGVEIYFDPVDADDLVPRIEEIANRLGIDGWTLITDKKFDPATGAPAPREGGVIGVRAQWVPEISIRWDTDLRDKYRNNPGALVADRDTMIDAMDDLVNEVSDMTGVSHAMSLDYKTAVFGKNGAGDKLDDYSVSTPARRIENSLDRAVSDAILRLDD